MAALESPISVEKAPSSPSTQVTNQSNGPKSLEEAIKPASPVKEAPKPPGGDRFAALAKKERALQKQMSEIKAAQAKMSDWEKARTEATTNPIKALEMLGLSYEQITQFMLNGNKVTPELEIQAVKKQIADMKVEQENKVKAELEASQNKAKAEYQRTLSEFNQEVGDFVKQHSGDYELTAMYQGEAIISATIEQHYTNTKKILSIKDAADLVEKYFEDQVAAAQKTKKFQAKQTPKEEKGQPKRESVSKQSTPTISNELTSSAPSLLPAKTEQDRINRAMAALEKAAS